MTPVLVRSAVALAVLLIGSLGFGGASFGHALQPGYLELRLIGEDVYAVAWKVPVTGGKPMAIAAQLPERCDPRTPGQPRWDGLAYVSRWPGRNGKSPVATGLARGSILPHTAESTEP